MFQGSKDVTSYFINPYVYGPVVHDARSLMIKVRYSKSDVKVSRMTEELEPHTQKISLWLVSSPFRNDYSIYLVRVWFSKCSYFSSGQIPCIIFAIIINFSFDTTSTEPSSIQRSLCFFSF